MNWENNVNNIENKEQKAIKGYDWGKYSILFNSYTFLACSILLIILPWLRLMLSRGLGAENPGIGGLIILNIIFNISLSFISYLFLVLNTIATKIKNIILLFLRLIVLSIYGYLCFKYFVFEQIYYSNWLTKIVIFINCIIVIYMFIVYIMKLIKKDY